MLIVTHQKRTMEIAGMLYGMSLNTDGTTKVVAQRLDSDRAEPQPVVAVPASQEFTSPPVG